MGNELAASNSLANTSQVGQPGQAAWQSTLFCLFIGLVILSYSYFHTVIETISVWNNLSHYRSGWLVIPTIALLLFFSRKDLQAIRPEVSWYGVLCGLAFSILWIASDLVNVSVLRQLALLGVISGLVLTAVGGAVFRVLLPYLALLLLAVPVWEVLLPGLKLLAVEFVSASTQLVGVPLTTDGFALFVDDNRYVVIDYCAGLPYVLIGLLIGASYGLLISHSYLKIALISLVGGCVAILANGIRISSIISFEYFTGINVDNHHYLFDLPVVIPCFAVLFFMLSKLKPDKLNNSNQSKRYGGKLSTLHSSVLVVATAVIFSAGPIWVNNIDRLSPKGSASLKIEERIGGWTRADKVVGWHPEIRPNGIKEDLGVYYLNDTEIRIYVAEPRHSDVKISGQAINLTDEGWMNYSHPHSETFCENERCNSYGYLSSALKDSGRIRHIYFGYAVSGMMTSSTLSYRVHRAFANVAGKGSSARYIAIVFEGDTGLSQNTLSPIFHDLASLIVVE